TPRSHTQSSLLFFFMTPRPPRSTLFPYTTLFRSYALQRDVAAVVTKAGGQVLGEVRHPINTSDFSSFLLQAQASKAQIIGWRTSDRKSTRLNSSHVEISYAVFCLKKKKITLVKLL